MKIVITGIGAVSCQGIGLPDQKSMSTDLAAAESAFLQAESLKNSVYHTPIFLRRRDRFTLLVIEALQQAIDQGALTPPLADVGLVVSSQLASWNTVQAFTKSLVQDGPGKINAAVFTNVSSNASQGQAAIQFGLTGPVSMLQGGEGLSYAFRLVQTGRAQQLLTVGADEYNELYAGEMMRRGVQPECLFAEGSCSLLLETEESARTRNVPVYAELVDTVVCSENRGAQTFLDADPEGDALLYAWRQLFSRNGLQPDDIGALFTAANGIASFDSAEQRALGEVFGPAPRPEVIPVKQWFGETLGAAGHFATAVAAEALHKGRIAGEYCIVNTWEAPGTVSTILLRRVEAETSEE